MSGAATLKCWLDPANIIDTLQASTEVSSDSDVF